MITTVTLNASIDKAYYMNRSIADGTVMRVDSVRNTAGGKGLNVARVVKLCGEQVLAAGFVGGYNGRYLEALLDGDGISHDFDHVEGETRSCINILDEAFGSTEYLEPGCQIREEEETRFLERFPGIIDQSPVVTLSGSVPAGVGRDIYRRLVEVAKKAGKQVILDTSGELLKQGIQGAPTVVKPNQEELEALYGIQIQTVEDVIAAGRRLQQAGIPWVVISLGGDGALMICREGVFQGRPPRVKVVNTVGCGDSMVGALAVALYRGYEPEKALRYGVAVATANALSPGTGNFDPAVSEGLAGKIELVRLG